MKSLKLSSRSNRLNMGMWDFSCEECDKYFKAATRKKADDTAWQHTKETGHDNYHTSASSTWGK